MRIRALSRRREAAVRPVRRAPVSGVACGVASGVGGGVVRVPDAKVRGAARGVKKGDSRPLQSVELRLYLEFPGDVGAQ